MEIDLSALQLLPGDEVQPTECNVSCFGTCTQSCAVSCSITNDPVAK